MENDEFLVPHGNSLNAILAGPLNENFIFDPVDTYIVRCLKHLYHQNLILHSELEKLKKEKKNA